MSKSILCNEEDKKCFICGKRGEVDTHHCLSGTSNRENSEDYGLKIYLCRDCHSSLHDKGKIYITPFICITENDIKKFAQQKWEETFGKENPREEFIAIFGKSWILED